MEKKDFTTTITVDQTPKQAYEAINNVRSWWIGEIEGPTDQLNEEFTFRYKELHYSKHKLIEMIPEKKVVWLTTDSSLYFVKDKQEWNGSTISFEISPKAGKTEIRFTHHGLIPQIECYDSCSNAWTGYIQSSLRTLISGGFSTSILVDATPKEAFTAVTNVRGWWSEEIEGGTSRLNDEFTYHYKDVHRCTMKLIEVISDKRVVWLCTFNDFSFTEDKREWIGTRVSFDISGRGDQTEIRFTHFGLVPAYECFDVCQNAWTTYIHNSLRNLIATGKGNPNPKENQSIITK
jgi:hypothetical protein